MTGPPDETASSPAGEAAADQSAAAESDKAPDSGPDAPAAEPPAAVIPPAASTPPPAWPPPADRPTAAPVSGSPVSGAPVSGAPVSGAPTSPAGINGQPGQPGAFPPDPFGVSGHQPDRYVPAAESQQDRPAPKRRRLPFMLVALAIVLVLCGGGGTTAYFLMQNAEGRGQAAPVDAVNLFLQAVYKNKDVDEAMRYVCPSSRDHTALSRRIDDIRANETKLRDPSYTWQTPNVVEQSDDTARLSATVKLTTRDDRSAELRLNFIAVDDDGWWVCEITG